MEHNITTIGGRIRFVRKKNKMTQGNLGEKLNLSKSTISSIENGIFEPSLENTVLLSQIFGVSLSWLLTGKETQSVRVHYNNASITSNVEEPDGNNYAFADLPLITFKARASFIESYHADCNVATLDTYRVYNISKELMEKKPVVIDIYGDSMHRVLPDGSKALAVCVDKADWPYISGKVCAVAFGDYFVVKRIKSDTIMSNGEVTLYSEDGSGDKFTISASEVHGIWHVVEALKVPMP